MFKLGLALIIAVLLWDADALRIGVSLPIVFVFASAHLIDYLTVGRLLRRAEKLYNSEVN